MSKICTSVVMRIGILMIFVSAALVVVSMVTFSATSIESLKTTRFLMVLVWGFAIFGFFILGYGKEPICGHN